MKKINQHPVLPAQLGSILLFCSFIHPVQAETLQTRWTEVQVDTVTENLLYPWGFDFLQDGRILVTERPGRLRIVATDGSLSEPISNLPPVSQHNAAGGLLDVVLSPDFSSSQRIYFSYTEPQETGSNIASTAVAHARLDGNALHDVTVIFRQYPKVQGGWHHGGRMAFSADGTYLFVGFGDHGHQPMQSQQLDNHTGTLIRIYPDGSVPADNPFVSTEGALPEIWSYGHRNIQGLAIQPETNRLWAAEHGPQGGDEINIPEAGKNYGWPIITYGEEYGGGEVPTAVGFKKEGMELPVWHWTPSIAVSGIAFYDGDAFPHWHGNLFATALRDQLVSRLEVVSDRIIHEERMSFPYRIREVRQGPSGYIYLLTDEQDGKILRLRPKAPV